MAVHPLADFFFAEGFGLAVITFGTIGSIDFEGLVALTIEDVVGGKYIIRAPIAWQVLAIFPCR